jgi:transcription factor TGA
MLYISEAAMFDVEYARWLEEHHRLVCELRAAIQEHIHENDLRMFVDKFLAQIDQLMHLKSLVAKSDIFHLVSGMWVTPAERCFMWIGGFKPSELIKVTYNITRLYNIFAVKKKKHYIILIKPMVQFSHVNVS